MNEAKRHRWMAFVPFEVTPEDALRLTGKTPFEGADKPPTQLAGDESPPPGDERPFFGLHNIVRELMTVGCYDCEQPVTPENVNKPCSGDPADGIKVSAEEAGIVAPTVGFSGVGRNDKCPCGSGKKFKRCHGA